MTESEFEQALADLQAEDRPVTRQILAQLSDASRAESESFSRRLAQMSAERKREIMSRMVEYAEESFEMDFVALFKRCLSDRDPLVRRLAIEGLWEYEGPDLVSPLLRMISGDADVAVRAAAAISAGRFLFLAECDELDAQRGEQLREALERVVANSDEDVEVVRRAIESLAYINDDALRDTIQWAYRHADHRMRESALFAMGRSADSFWETIVLKELDSASPAMRYEATRASGELQLKSAVARLIELGEGADREIQAMAIWALGQIGGDRAQKALEKWANSDDEALNEAAAAALDEVGLSSQSLDLFVHQFSGLDLRTTEELDEVEDEDEDGNEDLDLADEEWDDDALDLV